MSAYGLVLFELLCFLAHPPWLVTDSLYFTRETQALSKVVLCGAT